jgi:putative DNA primase/helicase
MVEQRKTGALSQDEIRVLARKTAEEERERVLESASQSDDDVCFERKAAGFSSDRLYEAATSGQDGDAELFAELHRGRFRYDHSAGCWFVWNGHHWIEDRMEEDLTGFGDVVSLYEGEVERLRWRMSRADKRTRGSDSKILSAEMEVYASKINLLHKLNWKRAVLKLASAGRGSLAITGDEWDSHPLELGCCNGVIDLRTGKLRPGRQSDHIKTVCPTEYHGPDNRVPKWEQFLQRLLGYAITGLTTEHIMPIFCGQGRNGKGTLIEVLGHVLGPLAGPIQSEMLLEQSRSRSSSSPSPDIMALRGRRLAWASETDEGRRLDISKVKWLCGGDTLVGRAPYAKHEVSFKPMHQLFLLTNNRPAVSADDYALWQRMILIPFDISFVDNPRAPNERKRNPRILEELKSEASGILSWLVRGCLAWQEEKRLNPPHVIREATARYRQSEDLIGQFIDECCAVGPGKEVKAGDLYKAYKDWCASNGHSSLSQTKFGKRIKRQFGDSKSNRVSYVGLDLNDQD